MYNIHTLKYIVHVFKYLLNLFLYHIKFAEVSFGNNSQYPKSNINKPKLRK